MSIYGLERVFRPREIALIGASEKPGTIGSTLMKNLLSGDVKGGVFPVNPARSVIMGIPAHPSIRDLGRPVDLSIIAAPILKVPGIVRECAETGVGGAVIISAGGKETGEQGRKIEPVTLEPETLARLDRVLPRFWSRADPESTWI